MNIDISQLDRRVVKISVGAKFEKKISKSSLYRNLFKKKKTSNWFMTRKTWNYLKEESLIDFTKDITKVDLFEISSVSLEEIKTRIHFCPYSAFEKVPSHGLLMEVMVALYTSPGTHLIFDGRESRDLKTKRWDKVNINEDSFYLDIPKGKDFISGFLQSNTKNLR